MKIKFLGTGTSTGVPEIGCKCSVCTSTDARDRRLRTSALIEVNNRRLLIDCGPDFRRQMLDCGVNSLDAVLITHEHYDHVGGLDDLRPFSASRPVDIYAEENVVNAIRTRMPYAFGEYVHKGLPDLCLNVIGTDTFDIAGISITPVRILHGCLPILGFRIGDLAYITDVKAIPENEYSKLKGVRILAIDALRKREHPTHESLDEALAHVRRISPETTFLIHLSHHFGLYSEEEKRLPAGVQIAFDGLEITLS
jgi:phosphoribosyl 1,2-cyclic phosphate phosphodiesterase